MNSNRIEEIQEQCAYPESQSVYTALCQVWNEVGQEYQEDIQHLKKKLEQAQARNARLRDWENALINDTADIEARAVEKAIAYASPCCYSVPGMGDMLSESTLYRYAQKLRQQAKGGE